MNSILETRTFDEKGHADEWRNEVARQLNLILKSDLRARESEAAVSIVRRVAEFEKIQMKLSASRALDCKP